MGAPKLIRAMVHDGEPEISGHHKFEMTENKLAGWLNTLKGALNVALQYIRSSTNRRCNGQ